MKMSYNTELNHNFPKLAEESGFRFNTHRPRVHIEWKKIRVVDIESIIRERKFGAIEQHINDILDCVLESEFDVRILDEGVLKMFRLAQLSVEYQQFCRHYLDRSVYVLREEITALAQELDSTSRLLKEKEEEIKKIRRKSKHFKRPSLSYGNENIASMILKTLSNKGDIFPSLASADVLQLQHNKCRYCDKVFLNQLYLESHISRRHANASEIPQKDSDTSFLDRNRDENVKLNNEIAELKFKLANMEKLIVNFGNSNTPEKKIDDKQTSNSDFKVAKQMKDVEVSTNSEGYILDKIEEWKKEEHDKYNKEINLLRTQIIDIINSYKEKETQNSVINGSDVMIELHETIKQQGAEITALQLQLSNSKSDANIEQTERRNEIEAQMAYLVKRAEVQSNEYKALLQKLKEVSIEAQESRARADMERKRVAQLQILLQQQNKNFSNNTCNSHTMEQPPENTNVVREPVPVKSSHPKTISVEDRTLSMERLQRKAQELLNMERSSTSDTSSTSDDNILKTKINKQFYDKKVSEKNQKSTLKTKKQNRARKPKIILSTSNNHRNDSEHSKNLKLDSHKEKLTLKENTLGKKENGSIITPGSPVKIIRAKITEEVNNRLAKLGVDPLKSRIPLNIFQKQRTRIQEHQELKFKKNPNRELVLHSLLAHLDLKTTSLNKDASQRDSDNISTKTMKPFSLASVISNVKTKALSLVKTNDMTKNIHKTYDDVAKKAMFLLKTPPSSTHSSPKIFKRENSPVKINFNNKESTKENRINKNNESDTEMDISNQEYDENQQRTSTSIENIKPAARQSSQNSILNYSIKTRNKAVLNHTSGILQYEGKISTTSENKENSSDDVESLVDQSPRRALSEENILKQTKGVLKNASSTSSLNKKKVIFDMDAIQMKSVSASSPSQSIITEKSDANEKYQQGQGSVHFNNEEWDISSIENEPLQQSNQSKTISRTTPRIAELKQTIESQLKQRNNTLPSGLVGSVDVLTGASMKKLAIGGSNTSLGSSILDDTDNVLVQNQIAFVKPKYIEKDDSEIDILSPMKL